MDYKRGMVFQDLSVEQGRIVWIKEINGSDIKIHIGGKCIFVSPTDLADPEKFKKIGDMIPETIEDPKPMQNWSEYDHF